MTPNISVLLTSAAIGPFCVMPQAYPDSRLECLTRDVGVSKAFGRDGPVLVRVGTAAVVGVAAAVAVGVRVGWAYAPAAGWMLTAAFYLVFTRALIAHMYVAQSPD